MLNEMFNPKSVAIVGASNKEGKVGYAVLKNMLDCDYEGEIFPINPKESEVMGLKAYACLADVPKKIDLLVVTVPAKAVVAVTKESATIGIKFLVVITAGFKEIGKEGLDREKEILDICKKNNIRMVGPNCLGMIDTHTKINTSFATVQPLKGEIAFFSQSGAMLVAILDWSRSMGIGFSKVVSLGNKADLSEIDFIEEASNDPYTKVILCYIEDVSDGKRFLEVVGKATKKKPVIILKSGISQAGAQAASSHTGALAGSDLAYDTAFRQCGVIRARTMTELFDLATVFSKCTLPTGDKVSIITNSGGPGIIATDNVEVNGLTVARYNKDTIDALREGLPLEAGIYNPVDVLGDAKTDRYRFALEKVCQDDNTDIVVLLLCQTSSTNPIATGEALLEIKKNYPQKTFIASYMGGNELLKGAKMLSDKGIPCYTFPEMAISGISHLVCYKKYLDSIEKEDFLNYPDVDEKTVKAIFYDVLKDRRQVLLGSEAAEVAKAYGIKVAPIGLALTPDKAVEIADQIGYPVVLKVASPKIMHKTDVGGVKVNLNSAKEVREGFLQIIDSVHHFMPQATIYGIEVNKMMEKGTELIIGMNRDLQFGPMVACGLGGIYVNLMKDVSFRLVHGLTLSEIKSMIQETKSYNLLRGYRGDEPKDINAVVDAVGRVAKLALDFPEITELDINPIFSYVKGLSALDVKITITKD